jgi:hypothetical protein
MHAAGGVLFVCWMRGRQIANGKGSADNLAFLHCDLYCFDVDYVCSSDLVVVA